MIPAVDMPFIVPAGRKITTIKSSYGTPKWFDAVYNADIEYIKKHPKNINKKDELGYTALHHAAIAGKVEVVSLLLEAGEQVDSKGQDGATPLRCAVQEGHTGVVALLLAKGASIQDKDEDELTVLHCAAGEGHEPIARLLLSRAPYLANEQSKSGWSPVHSAAVMGHAHVVRLLIEYGADLKLTNNQGKTAGELAKERNKTEVCRTIERMDQSAGASAAAVPAVPHLLDSLGLDDDLGPLEDVWKVLECPVCLEIMTNKKIFQCLNGHNVCEECSRNASLSSCPQCRVSYASVVVRNRGLEELARVQNRGLEDQCRVQKTKAE